MTREEAIDVLKHNYPSSCFTDLCEAVEMAIQALSAQPEPMWIPVSERLPEKKVDYLVTVPGLIGISDAYVTVCSYGKPLTGNKHQKPCFYMPNSELGDLEIDDVIAWMPLPKKYERREWWMTLNDARSAVEKQASC